MINYGIDKTVVKNFRVKEINWDRLLSNNNVVVCENTKNSNYIVDNKCFEYIRIIDNTLFNNLKVGIKVGQGIKKEYEIIDLSIKENDGNNLIPLLTEAYVRQLLKIFKYINERYGIMCNIEELKWDKVELNTTITLKEEFKNYKRIFDVLMNLAPRTYKDYYNYKNRNSDYVDYFLIKNKSIQVKFYNKAKQVEEVYKLDTKENIMRIEYTLLSGEKIKDVFGTNNVEDITDKQIKEFIQQQFQKDFIDRYNKYKEKSIKQLTKLAKEIKKAKKQWLKSFIMLVLDLEISNKTVCIDIEHLKEVVKEMDKVNYSRNIKRINKDLPNSYKNQEEKIFEIFQKIENL